MRPIGRFGVSLIAGLVLIGSAAARPAQAQTKTARGTATTVTDVSLTVKVGDKDMTFDVDSKTIVQAPGAGRQTRVAQTAGAAGIKLTSVIQSGQPVLVTYREVNGKNLATDISRVSTAGSGGGSMSDAPSVPTGTVKSVSASSLVITSQGKDLSFAIDQGTQVVGRGAGTAAAASGGRVLITSLVAPGDTVSVNYAGAPGMLRATEVRITAKAR
jgi:hypothetical protein